MLTNQNLTILQSMTVADHVHEAALAAIVAGSLGPNDELHDKDWAERFGVSRTPIREAFKRLEMHGLVDVAAARFTRVRRFTAEEAHEAVTDWVMLHESVVASVSRHAVHDLIRRLRRIAAAECVTDPGTRHATHFEFFQVLRDATPSFGLRLGATAAAYRYRLAASSLPDRPDAGAVLRAGIIEALERADAHAVQSAFAHWARVRVPLMAA